MCNCARARSEKAERSGGGAWAGRDRQGAGRGEKPGLRGDLAWEGEAGPRGEVGGAPGAAGGAK